MKEKNHRYDSTIDDGRSTLKTSSTFWQSKLQGALPSFALQPAQVTCESLLVNFCFSLCFEQVKFCNNILTFLSFLLFFRFHSLVAHIELH